MTQQETFISTIGPRIAAIAMQRGYKFPSAIIAQACLESGYGGSLLSRKYFNFFGMKCGSAWRGASVNMNTQEEFRPGVKTTIRDNFRCYAGYTDGINGYFDFIGAARYSNLKGATSPEDYLQKIKADGYATASTYVARCVEILNRYNLRQFDGGTVGSPESHEKDLKDIARKVVRGEYGNGAERARRLQADGYDYKQVQALVNSYFKGVWR